MFAGVGVIVVCLIILVYVVACEPTWATLPFWQCHLSRDPEYVLSFSDGTFDQAARLAYKRSLDAFQNPNTPVGVALEDGARIQRIAYHYMSPTQREEYSPEVEDVLAQTVELLEDDNEDIDLRIAIMNSLENTINYALPVRRNITRSVTKTAKESGDTKAEQSDTFIELSKKNTDDPESVHDPTANACNRAVIQRIKTDISAYSLGDIEKFFRDNVNTLTKDPHGGKPRPQMLTKVLRILHEKDSQIISLEENLHDIILYVWARIHHPKNADNAASMRQTMFDQFYDCYKLGLGGEQSRCSHGIATNILGVLTPLDFDSDNNHILRQETIRNEIYEKIKVAVDDMAQAESSSSDAARAAVARSYLGELTDLDSEAEEKYGSDLRAKLHALIQEEVAKNNAKAPGSAPERFERMLLNEIDQMY